MKLSRSCLLLLSALLLLGAGCGDDDDNPVGGPSDGADRVVLTLRNMGDPSPDYFALWAEEGSVRSPVAFFSIEDGAPTTPAGDPLGSFEQEERISGADRLIVTLEPDTAATAPAGPTLLAGVPTDLAAELTLASGVGADLSGAAGFYRFDTPSSADEADLGRGVWWTDGAGAAGLTLPVLSGGWTYEGWVIHRETGAAYSTGRFTDPSAADADGPGATGGGGDGYPFPGQDFLTAAGGVPVIDVDGGIYEISVTLEPTNDSAPGAPFFLTLLDKDAGSGNLTIEVENFPSSAAGTFFEIWAVFPDSTVSLGGFTYSNGTVRDPLTGEALAGFPVGSNVLAATAFLISIEPDDGDPSPSGAYFLGADANGDTLEMTTDHSLAFGAALDGAGSYTLDTPSSPWNDADYARGLWFYEDTGTDTVASLSVPVLPAGWVYEGWIVRLRTGITSDTLISIGTFADPNGADSDGAGAFADTGAVPAFPGQDYLVGSNRRFDNSAYGVKISLEPADDPAPEAPFLLLYEDALVSPQGQAEQQDLTNLSGDFPGATGVLRAERTVQMNSRGGMLPKATIHFGSK